MIEKTKGGEVVTKMCTKHQRNIQSEQDKKLSLDKTHTDSE